MLDTAGAFLAAAPVGAAVVVGAFGATFFAGGCCAATERSQKPRTTTIILICMLNPSLSEIAADHIRREPVRILQTAPVCFNQGTVESSPILL